MIGPLLGPPGARLGLILAYASFKRIQRNLSGLPQIVRFRVDGWTIGWSKLVSVFESGSMSIEIHCNATNF